jgi:Flp pilus assembly protein TadG
VQAGGRRERQRGAMMVIMAATLLLMGVLGIGVLTILRIVIARQEVQRMADAACLAATTIIKHDGLGESDQGWESKATALAYRNDPGPAVKLFYTKDEEADKVNVQCQATLDVSAPLVIWASGRVVVSASAQGTIGQVTETDATRLYPNLILVLDFSGSMANHLGGNSSQPKSITKLRESVDLLLQSSTTFKFGMVLFASDVIDKVAPALGTADTIHKKMQGNPGGCPEGGNDCETASGAGLAAALKLIQDAGNPDEAKYVLFVSDGQPTVPVDDPDGAAKSAAQALWAADVMIMTLHIINVADHDYANQLAAFMQWISGYPEKPHDPTWYFNADSADKMDQLFSNLGDAIGCPLTPLNPPPKDPNNLHIFVKDGPVEIPVGNAALANPQATTPGDLTDHTMAFYDGNWFFYRAKNHSVYLSKPVCAMVIDEHKPVVIRAGMPHLTQ